MTGREQHFDLVVVGGGSAGYAAARTARELGATIAIVDPGPLGGLCILQGCMPSKALLASADAAERVREAPRLGVNAGAPSADIPAIIARKRLLVDGFARYRRDQLETFPIFSGPAAFADERTLVAGDQVLVGGKFLIATGSVIARPEIAGLEDAGYLTSDDVLAAERLPESMLVLGGGYVASELGQYLHRVGVRTEILIRGPRLLSSEDADVAESLTAALRSEGVTITTGAQIERVERAPGGGKTVVWRRDGVEHRSVADQIALFLGRVPAIADLHLERAGVRAHLMTGVEIDANLRTSNPNIYAAGDVTGKYQLVHVAIAQGECAAKNALTDTQTEFDYEPQKAHTIFTEPQIAVAGKTERELAQAGIAYLRASYSYADHGKAMTIGRTAGFVKMMAAPGDGRILGAAVVGAEGSELIHEIIVALHYNATVGEFMRIPHLHPTLAEIWTYPAEELAAAIAQAATPASSAAAP